MIDLEVVTQTDDGTRSDKLIAVVIGAVAILAAVLGTIQIDLAQKESRAAALGARLGVQVVEELNGGEARVSFDLQARQDAVAIAIAALSRQLAALGRGGEAPELDEARSASDQAASDRLLGIAAAMGAPPGPADQLDPAVRRVLSADLAASAALSLRQNSETRLAEDFGARAGRSVLGLSLVALAGVLLGLAAVLGEGPAGRFALSAAVISTAAAAAAAISTAIKTVA